eukprot:MONOS_4723.1-p1 / transcript=MONOS_4723.1 / gene=MONOS_4723 / organism=Monocercomonoides_exilis_PA203 / gene_product=unspecified product / transcript_product=unspecified product / location=Mono_scaffold00129:38142-39116(+) / protein_length=305 / sequence_SO=supercontig / SO=protein_coding / is_pseudo=false
MLCCFDSECVVSEHIFSICSSYLLLSASCKETNEKAKNDVENAILALSNCIMNYKHKKGKYLFQITEIIKYDQEYHNLTSVAKQSAWIFLDKLLFFNGKSEHLQKYDLHFAKDTTAELAELERCVDWENDGKCTKGLKEVYMMIRWFGIIERYVSHIIYEGKEFVELIKHIVGICQAADKFNREIVNKGVHIISRIENCRTVIVEYFLQSGAVDFLLKEISCFSLTNEIVLKIVRIFFSLSESLLRKEKKEYYESKNNEEKEKIFEHFEEEGYEDIIISYFEQPQHQTQYFLQREDLSGYFVSK